MSQARQNRNRSREIIAEGFTIRQKTGCGNLYITINEDEYGAVETFIKLGKSGGCSSSQIEAIGRLISIGLQYNVPIDEIIEQLKLIRCPEGTWDNNGYVFSCSDAVAKALQTYRDEIVYQGEDEEPEQVEPEIVEKYSTSEYAGWD